MNLIKNVADIIYVLITKLINECITKAIFPSTLKISRVKCVFKKKDLKQLSNYRPILLVPILSQILETILKNRIILHIEQNSLLNNSQYRFRKSLFTTKSISDLVEFTLNCFQKSENVTAVLCDLIKVFDSVSHKIFSSKTSVF